MVSFTAEVYANDQSSLEDTARIDREKSADPSTAMVFDKLYFRHWDKYDNHKNSHIFTVPMGSNRKLDISRASNWMRGIKSLSSPIDPFGDASNFKFSTDGKELLFASMAKFDESPQAWSTETHIYHVSESSKGVVKCLTCDMGVGAKNNPSFSPNGRYIAWTQMERAQFEADKTNLMLLDRKNGGKVTVLTKDLDRSVGSYVWSTNSEKIYFVVDDSGRSRLYSTGVDYGSKPVELLEESHISTLSSIPGSNNLILGVASMMAPTEFYSFNVKTKEMTKLTEVNTNYLNGISVSRPEKFWFEGDGNDKVMGWLLKPYNFQPNKKYPLAFLIHGGPQSAWTDNFSTRWNPQVFAGAGYAVVMINFHGSTGYGQNFTDSISGYWGGAPFNDLMKGLDHVLEKYSFIDSNRIAGLGASYGGYMINWINGHSDRFNCLVNHDGLFDVKTMYYTTEELYFTEYEFNGAPFQNRDLYDKWNPSEFVQNWKTPTLVIHGGTDYRVPQGEGFATFTALQRQGIESRLVFFPDENHWVLKPANSLRWHKEVLGWINHFTRV
jgi:dipeptidyl aminopeptidase/acylaminoacyl peptidase